MKKGDRKKIEEIVNAGAHYRAHYNLKKNLNSLSPPVVFFFNLDFHVKSLYLPFYCVDDSFTPI